MRLLAFVPGYPEPVVRFRPRRLGHLLVDQEPGRDKRAERLGAVKRGPSGNVLGVDGYQSPDLMAEGRHQILVNGAADTAVTDDVPAVAVRCPGDSGELPSSADGCGPGPLARPLRV